MTPISTFLRRVAIGCVCLAMTTAAAAQDPRTLPTELSPWSMFITADIVVKTVMVGLAVASLATWTVWLAKSVELFAAKRQLKAAFEDISEADGLTQALTDAGARRGVARALLRAAALEQRRSADALSDRDGLKERIASHLERIAGSAAREMTRGAGLLATIGATAPFVGLFGTVWGVMNSFVGISQAKTSNLAVVAPGIAEALLATAAGLFAAIPAVVIYNHFTRQMNGYRALIGDTAAAVLRLVSRDLSLGKADASASTGLKAGG